MATRIAGALERDADLLGAHWEARARALTPTAEPASPAEGASGRAPGPDNRSPNARDLVRALLSSLANVPSWRVDVTRRGWEYGAAAHRGGRSLHVVLRHLTLLGEVLLHASEIAAGKTGDEAGARAGVAVARRLHRAVAMLSAGAAQGFTHAHLERLQDRYRSVRHDLRNPLGTIKNAVALMDDESVPAEVRANPRYRAIITRSVSAIDGLIGERLDEASALAAALDWHEVSLAAVAQAVRREMREEMVRARAAIEVDDALPTVLTDPAVFELALASALAALLRAAPPDTTIRIALDRLSELSAVVSISLAPRQRADAVLTPDALDFARSLLAKAGGRATAAETVCLELPVLSEG